MGDHHQVKTSFLFIQLQSPSKAHQQPHHYHHQHHHHQQKQLVCPSEPESIACLDATEEGYHGASAEGPGPSPEAQQLQHQYQHQQQQDSESQQQHQQDSEQQHQEIGGGVGVILVDALSSEPSCTNISGGWAPLEEAEDSRPLDRSTDSITQDGSRHGTSLCSDEECLSLTEEEDEYQALQLSADDYYNSREEDFPFEDDDSPAETPVWILREARTDVIIMSEEGNPVATPVVTPPRGSTSPRVPPKPSPSPSGRTSFLYPTGTHEPLKIAPEAGGGKLAEAKSDAEKPKGAPYHHHQQPSAVQPTMGTGVHRTSSNSWVYSAKRREEASSTTTTSAGGQQDKESRSSERATFMSAVIQRSSKLYGGDNSSGYRKSVSPGAQDNGSSSSSVAPAAAEPCVKRMSPPVPVRSSGGGAFAASRPLAKPADASADKSSSSPVMSASVVGKLPKPDVPPKPDASAWVNNSSHAQSVAKAKYEFLFGKAEESSTATATTTTRVSPTDTEPPPIPPAKEKESGTPPQPTEPKPKPVPAPKPDPKAELNLESPLLEVDEDDDGELDETSLFQEIDRELASLLSGLKARCRDAGVVPHDDLDDQDPSNHHHHHDEVFLPSTTTTASFYSVMIPCNGASDGRPSAANVMPTAAITQNGSPNSYSKVSPGKAAKGSEREEEEDGVVGGSGSGPSSLHPSDSFILNTWAEALGQDDSLTSLTCVTEELQALSAGLLSFGNVGAPGQDKPQPPPPSQTAAGTGTSGDVPSAAAAAAALAAVQDGGWPTSSSSLSSSGTATHPAKQVQVQVQNQNQTQSETETEAGTKSLAGQHSRVGGGGGGGGSGGMLDASLEESSKILAEIPGIFTAFLDGGQAQAREKPLKKLRFVESGSREDGSTTTGSGPGSGSSGSSSSSSGGSAVVNGTGTGMTGTGGGGGWMLGEEQPQPQPQLRQPQPGQQKERLETAGSGGLVTPGVAALEDEVFRPNATPDIRVLSPDSESASEQSARSGDGAEAKRSQASDEATDVFSSQFESIVESDRLRSTLYSSLDSLDALSSNDDLDAASHDLDNNPSKPNDPGAEPEAEPAAFTFDLPLTPMIQQRLKESSHFLDGMDWGGTGSGGGRQEVLSVMSTGRSGKGALEMTTSFVDVMVDTGGDPRHHQGTPVSTETQSRASSDGGHSGSDGGHSGGSGGPVANGLAEDAGQDSKDWLQGCLR